MSMAKANTHPEREHETRLRCTVVAIRARTLRAISAAVATAALAAGVFTPQATANSLAPACPDTVIPNAAVIPNAIGCWNAIAVQTVRLATPVPGTRPDLPRLQPGGRLRRGHEDRGALRPVSRLPSARRRERRARVARRRDGRRGVHDPDVALPGL